MTAIDRDQALAALKHCKSERSVGVIVVDLREVLEKVAALPAIPLDPKTELVWIHRDDVHWETENGWLIEANIFDEAWRFSLSTAGADYRFRQGYGSRSTLEAAQRLAQNLQNVFDDVGSVPVLETPPPPRDFFGVPWDQAPFVIMARIATALGVVDGEYENLVVDGPEELETVARRVKAKADSALVEPVPAPTSELRERIERLWMEAGCAVQELEMGAVLQDPLATARRYQGDMNALRTMIDNATFEPAPVPAPRDGLNHLDISLTNAQMQQLMDVTPVSADEAPDFWRDKLLSAPVPAPRLSKGELVEIWCKAQYEGRMRELIALYGPESPYVEMYEGGWETCDRASKESNRRSATYIIDALENINAVLSPPVGTQE